MPLICHMVMSSALVPRSAGNCMGREQKDGCPKELKCARHNREI